MIATLLVITDGRRECLIKTLSSLNSHLTDKFSYQIMVDDSCDAEYAAWLDTAYGKAFTIIHNAERYGFCKAVDTGWRAVSVDTTHVFHLEDDFEFIADVPLKKMAAVLDKHPKLMQIVLKRQPWNEQEKVWGDLVHARPEEFTEVTDGVSTWLEHRLFYSTNPNLLKAKWVRNGMSVVSECEGKFGLALKNSDPKLCFGFWGAFSDGPRVHHIGDERIGNGY